MGAGMAYLKLTQDAKFFKKDIQKLKSLVTFKINKSTQPLIKFYLIVAHILCNKTLFFTTETY